MERTIQKKFKFKGLSIRPNAVKALVNVLQREQNASESLNLIAEAAKAHMEREGVTKAVVDIGIIGEVVDALSKNEDDISQDRITVIDGFSLPRMKYQLTTKSFTKEDVDRQKGSLQTGRYCVFWCEVSLFSFFCLICSHWCTMIYDKCNK